MSNRGQARAWHVTGPRRTCAETPRSGRNGAPMGYVRGRGTTSPLPGRRCLLPRRDARKQPRADRARRLGPRRVPPHPPPRQAPVRVARPRQLPDGKPLPPGRRDPTPQPLRRHARPERLLRPRLQRAPPPPRPCLRTALLVEADRVGGAVPSDRRLRRQQPAAPRVRAPGRGMALGVGARSPSDRFAWCRTTPTS